MASTVRPPRRPTGWILSIGLLVGAAACVSAPVPAGPPGAPAPREAITSPEAAVPEATQGPSPSGIGAYRTLEDVSVREILTHLAREGGVDIDYRDRGQDVRVTVRYPEATSWEQVLERVAEEAGLEVEKRSARLYVVRQAQRITIEFQNMDIREAFLMIARNAGTSIIVGPGVEGTVSANLRGVPARTALETIARACGYVVVEEEAGWEVRSPGSS